MVIGNWVELSMTISIVYNFGRLVAVGLRDALAAPAQPHSAQPAARRQSGPDRRHLPLDRLRDNDDDAGNEERVWGWGQRAGISPTQIEAFGEAWRRSLRNGKLAFFTNKNICFLHATNEPTYIHKSIIPFQCFWRNGHNNFSTPCFYFFDRIEILSAMLQIHVLNSGPGR